VHRTEQVLVFVEDGTPPLTNNQAEQDLRMAKVQQEILQRLSQLGGSQSLLSDPQLSVDHT
jgi:hypothetical protein